MSSERDPYRSPSTHDWSYDQVCFKASHNSFEREERPITTQLPWQSDATHERGCRGLELDLQQSDQNWVWSVEHDKPYLGSVDRQLSEYLVQLREFSRRHEGHDVITVTLDIKEEATDVDLFPWAFDNYLQRHFDTRKLFTPSELRKGAGSLVEGAKREWPSLGILAGRFIFCLSGKEATKSRYAASGNDRLCFADLKICDNTYVPDPGSGSRVFLNFDFDGDIDLTDTARQYAEAGGFVLRGYDVNVGFLWKKAREAGVNILATDKVCRHGWATVGHAPFALNRRSAIA